MPNNLTRSTGTFPINVAGPPSSTGASLSWRYAGQTAWNVVDGITKDGNAWTGAVANTANGAASTSGQLLWDATGQEDPASTTTPKAKITAPALIELRTCFTHSTNPEICSATPRQIQLVPTAFGGNFPVAQVGPGSVALFTGEMSLPETDAIDTAAGVGRTFAAFDAATATPGAFGPGWSTSLLTGGDTTAKLLDRRSQDRSLVLVTAGGSSETLIPVDPAVDPTTASATSPVDFNLAEGDALTTLRLTDTTATLARAKGPVTVWVKNTAGKWEISETRDVTTPANDPEVTIEGTGVGYPTWIAQTEPGVATTCTATIQTEGCRGLKLTYTGTGTAMRVTQIEKVIGGTTPTSSIVATYDYTNGLLTKVAGADPDDNGPLTPLLATYEYDTTTVAGRTLLKKATPPGQQPWQFTYDATGRLTKVTRPLDPVTGTGNAQWTIGYDVPIGATGLPSFANAAHWGQTTLPTKAYAVFSPNRVPAPNPTASDLEYASLYYVDDAGTVTNTGVHGNVEGTSTWLLDTLWYDQHGNVVRTLDAAGRHRTLTESDPALRPGLAEAASSYTIYNDDDQDLTHGDGRRVEHEYGPARTATLKNGTTGTFRAHTAYVYDDEAPELGGGSKPAYPEGETSFDLVVETRSSATDPGMTVDHDAQVVRSEYEPVVAGDGNGWALGTPTRVKTQLEDGTWSTQVTRYDSQGRQIETRQPGGATNPDGSGADARSTVFTYYRPDAIDADCRSAGSTLDWTGLPCKTGPASQPFGTSIPVEWNAAYDENHQITEAVERTLWTGGTTVRSTNTTYDGLGRLITTTITATVAGGSDTRAQTFDHDPYNGLPTRVSDPSGSVSATYDSWGRIKDYADASGMTSTTTYLPDGLYATRSDGLETYTYSYDTMSGERRRLPGSIDTGAGTFTYVYGASGAPKSITYPNQMTASWTYDEIGGTTGLSYKDSNGTELLGFSAEIDVDGRVLEYASAASRQQYHYDGLDRLIKVEDIRTQGCVTRTYEFTAASERTASKSFGPATDLTCQTSTPTATKTHTYDAANRITNTGYEYDDLGRTVRIPASDTAPGGTNDLTASFYANDMVKSLTQNFANGSGGNTTKGMDYILDPIGRIGQIVNSADGAESGRVRYRFSNQGDSPTSIQTSTDGGATFGQSTRYIQLPGLSLSAIVNPGGEVIYQLANLHGDVVATQSHQALPGAIDAYVETDEYGNALDSTGSVGRYQWLGVHQRSAETMAGLVLMGARLYNPATGSFLSIDPIVGGGATRYAYPVDPINMLDLTGQSWQTKVKAWADRIAAINNWTIGMVPGFLCPICGAVFLVVAAAVTVMYFVAGYNKEAIKNAVSAGLGYLGSKKLAQTYVGKHMTKSIRVKMEKYLGPGLYSALINIVFG